MKYSYIALVFALAFPSYAPAQTFLGPPQGCVSWWTDQDIFSGRIRYKIKMSNTCSVGIVLLQSGSYILNCGPFRDCSSYRFSEPYPGRACIRYRDHEHRNLNQC